MNMPFSDEKIQIANKYMRKMLQIIDDLRNTSLTKFEISYHHRKNSCHQKTNQQQMLEWPWRKGNPTELLIIL